MSSLEPTDEPHEEYRYNGKPQSSKKHSIIRKILLVIAIIVTLLILIIVIGFVVLFVNYLGAPSTDMPKALSEAWQSVLNWTKPITDAYEQVVKLIPGAN